MHYYCERNLHIDIEDDDDEVVQHSGLTQQAEAVSAILCVNHFVLIQVPCRLPGFSFCSITTNPHLGMENAFNKISGSLQFSVVQIVQTGPPILIPNGQ